MDLRKKSGDFPEGPVIKTSPSNEGMWIWSLFGELRSYVLCITGTPTPPTPKKKERKKRKSVWEDFFQVAQW